MKGVVIEEGAVVDHAIVAEDVHIGKNVSMGQGEALPSKLSEKIYSFGLVTIGEKSVIPDNVTIGKNTAIAGVTTKEDYPDGKLESGEYIMKDGDQA